MSQFSEIRENPLLQKWTKDHGMPPFKSIKPEHFEPAFEYSMEHQLNELKRIAELKEEPGFSTIVSIDNCGSLFAQVSETFDNLCSSYGIPEIQEVELKMASKLAAHHTKIASYPGLFSKILEVHEKRNSLNLSTDQLRLVERYYLDFVRSGAKFDLESQARYSKIVEELADLTTRFTQNVMADEASVFIELKTEDEKAGLPSDLLNAAFQAAKERKIDDENTAVITLSRSLVEPFLVYSDCRSLREKAWKLWTSRGELDSKTNNHAIASRILELRAEQAIMHGYSNFAEFSTADTMASSPQKVLELLQEVWNRAKLSVGREREELEGFVKLNGLDIEKIEPWDWRYLAEKVRKQNYDLDNREVKPYFPLDNMVDAIFDVAYQLFGLKFSEQKDIETYHPDVKVYYVYQEDLESKSDQLVAVFLHDNYSRVHKRSGAWMSHFRAQHYDSETGRVIPIIINNNNFNKPSEGEVSLLSFDDAVTLFHEFGHGLHGMLSDVRYKRLAGTSVLVDFVELPSQLFEHWLSEKKVLQKHALHYQTKQPIPEDLLQRLLKARIFNQGFQTIEYTSSALVDVNLHLLSLNQLKNDFNLSSFEKNCLEQLGMPQGIVMRHRLPHFQHLFSGEYYSSRYYVYLWAEVLDADGFEAFLESGDCFDREVSQRLRKFIYSSGNSNDPSELFKQFRGRDPIIEPMLRKKGLI